MKYAFIIVCFLWICSEISLLLFFRAKKNQNTNTADKSSLLILWVFILFSIYLSIYLSNTTDYSIFQHQSMESLGIVVMAIGIVCRLLVVSYLGKSFTVNLAVNPEQKILKSGYYKYIRHPSYTFSLLTFIGFGIILNNWISLIILIVPVFVAFAYRIKLEEKLLILQFGKDYQDYTKHTKRLVPFIY